MDTLKQTAQEIRARLKARGMSARAVSVRTKRSSLDDSITVTINVPGISRSAVLALAADARSVDRCEVTGEILSGGNRFLHVGYSDDLLAQVRQAIREDAAQAFAAAKAEAGKIVTFLGLRMFKDGTDVVIWHESEQVAQARRAWASEDACTCAAARMLLDAGRCPETVSA